MRVIIAGGRDLQASLDLITETVAKSGFKITAIVSGNAAGIDTCGENWAKAHNIPVVLFPAQWDTHGKAAGPIRNKEMADYADALISFWDGKSPGTKNMQDQMYRKKKPVYVYRMDKHESKS